MLETSPIIIFGNPRSGTRMCASVFNTHPEVCITDEFQNVGMLAKLAEQQIAAFLKDRVDGKTIPIRKEMLVKSYWMYRSNLSLIEKSKNAKIIGNKSPRSEHHFHLFEELFAVNKPIYVYCARNAHDVLRSIKNLKNIQWSKLPFEQTFDNYKRSYRALAKIKKQARNRLFVVNVDRYEDAPLFEFYSPIFSALGINCSPEMISAINGMSPLNTLQSVRKKTLDQSPVVELTEKEHEVINSCTEYQEIRATLGFKN